MERGTPVSITHGQIGGAIDDLPAQEGWYATMHSWDAEEGMFPSAHFWDGGQWCPETSAAIIYWPILFESEEKAKRYADENDLEA